MLIYYITKTSQHDLPVGWFRWLLAHPPSMRGHWFTWAYLIKYYSKIFNFLFYLGVSLFYFEVYQLYHPYIKERRFFNISCDLLTVWFPSPPFFCKNIPLSLAHLTNFHHICCSLSRFLLRVSSHPDIAFRLTCLRTKEHSQIRKSCLGFPYLAVLLRQSLLLLSLYYHSTYVYL